MGFSLQIVQSKSTYREQTFRPYTGNRHSDIHREQMSGPHTGNRYTGHIREQIYIIQTTHWNRYTLYRPHTGTDIHHTDHTLEQIYIIQTTHQEQI